MITALTPQDLNFELIPFIWDSLKPANVIQPDIQPEKTEIVEVKTWQDVLPNAKKAITGPLQPLEGQELLTKYEAVKAGKRRSEVAIICGYNSLQAFYDALLDAKQKQASQQVTPPETATVKLKYCTSVSDVPVDQIQIDPKKFQFKLMAKADGTVGSLSGVKLFDANLAGVLLCWQDDQDNSIYVVNGHNRLKLASDLGVKTLPVKFIQADNAKQARFVGALANIAEKSCDIYDTSKFFRDNSLEEKELADRGICLKGSMVQDSLAVASLNNLLFDKFLVGEISPEIAIAIGNASLSEEKQNVIWQSIQVLIEKNKPLTKELLADFIESAKVIESYSQASLFGETQVNCAYEYARLKNIITAKFRKNTRLFGTAAKNAALLAEGDNAINTEKSTEISRQNQALLNWFKRESVYTGNVSQYLNSQARAIAEGKQINIDILIKNIYSMFGRSPAMAV